MTSTCHFVKYEPVMFQYVYVVHDTLVFQGKWVDASNAGAVSICLLTQYRSSSFG